MRHSMTIQIPLDSRWGSDHDLTTRRELEDALALALDGIGDVDGGDIGSGTMNVLASRKITCSGR
jgi:hypothetical protein